MAYEDAYSYDRYGATQWKRAIKALEKLGYSEAEVEVIMRSKYTRWAADQADGKRRQFVSSLVDYVTKYKNNVRLMLEGEG